MVCIDENRCKGCGLCIDVCPEKILELSKKLNLKGYFYAQVTDNETCTSCRMCALICPDVAIEVIRSKKKEAHA